MKERERRLKDANKEDNKVRFQNNITFRVVKYRRLSGASLNEAFEAVSGGTDRDINPRGYFNTTAYSVAKIRAAYMVGIKRARASGQATEIVGIFAPRRRSMSIEGLSKRGRRKKVSV